MKIKHFFFPFIFFIIVFSINRGYSNIKKMGIFQSKSDEINEIPPGLVDPDTVFEHYKDDWYQKSKKYWENVDADISGMLGGFPETSESDVENSRGVIEKLQKEKGLGNELVADVGCGIGRVSKLVLSKYFKRITAIEPVKKFLDVYEKDMKGVCEFETICCGSQEWNIDKLYDCFWCQWILFFLTDNDAVEFLKRCKNHLRTNGFIIIKDNVASHDIFARRDQANWFPDDRAIARTYLHYKELFNLAELEVVFEKFDEPTKEIEEFDLMPIYTFVLK